MECHYSDNPIEKWHAIFVATIQDNTAAYRAAARYGKTIVEMGLAKNYTILNKQSSGVVEYHVIPRNGPSKMIEYWNKVFDKNSGIC